MSTVRTAKFWLEPTVQLAQNFGMSAQQIRVIQEKIEAHAGEIRNAWQRHFAS